MLNKNTKGTSRLNETLLCILSGKCLCAFIAFLGDLEKATAPAHAPYLRPVGNLFPTFSTASTLSPESFYLLHPCSRTSL
jgi:hypothetical protein